MLILNQQRDRVSNTDSGYEIVIEPTPRSFESGYEIFIYHIDYNIISVGHYETKERCKEILADIIKKAEVGCNTYIMPKE